MKVSLFYSVLFTGALLLLCGSASAFLLENSNMDALEDFAVDTGWQRFGDPDAGAAISQEDWANGAPGTNGAYAQLDDGQFGFAFRAFSSTNGGFYQDALVSPGSNYTFTVDSHTAENFYLQVAQPSNGNVFINFEWWDGDPDNGGTMFTQDVNDITSSLINGGSDGAFPPGPSDSVNWQSWTNMITAPAGAAVLRPVMKWNADAVVTNLDEVMRWDNVFLTTDILPINESQALGDILQVDFNTQSQVLHTVESSQDLLDGFAAEPVPVFAGDESTQSYFAVFEDFNAYRVSNEDDSRLFFDGDNQESDAIMGKSQLFAFCSGSSCGGNPTGVWEFAASFEDLGGGNTNNVGVLVSANDATLGGNGISAHVNVDGPSGGSTGVKDHGPVVDGNVLRFSAWLKLDPAAPSNQNWAFALLKFEFYDVKLGNPDSCGCKIADTENPGVASGTFFTPYAGTLSTSVWNQYVFEYTYTNIDFNAASLEEIRGVVVQGDFSTAPFNGNVLVDNLRVEIFDDQDEADVNPVDMTVPGLPVPGIGFEAVLLDENPAQQTVIEWDAQLGARYILEYSEDGGSNWSPSAYTEPFLGMGQRMQATDPEGPSGTRIYRITLVQ